MKIKSLNVNGMFKGTVLLLCVFSFVIWGQNEYRREYPDPKIDIQVVKKKIKEMYQINFEVEYLLRTAGGKVYNKLELKCKNEIMAIDKLNCEFKKSDEEYRNAAQRHEKDCIRKVDPTKEDVEEVKRRCVESQRKLRDKIAELKQMQNKIKEKKEKIFIKCPKISNADKEKLMTFVKQYNEKSEKLDKIGASLLKMFGKDCRDKIAEKFKTKFQGKKGKAWGQAETIRDKGWNSNELRIKKSNNKIRITESRLPIEECLKARIIMIEDIIRLCTGLRTSEFESMKISVKEQLSKE